MNRRAIAARLAATRVTALDGESEGPLANIYRRWHADLVERLSARVAHLPASELYVARTANARSEMLTGASSPVIVHDQHLGRTLNRLTGYVVDDWPATRVHAWGFERVAVAAYAGGDFDACRLALALSQTMRGHDSPPEPEIPPGARQLISTIQEHFVLAHETAHTMLGTDALPRVKAALTEDVGAAFAASVATLDEFGEDIVSTAARDIAGAIGRLFGSGKIDEGRITALRESLSRPAGGVDESAWLDAHPHLYEEIACDLIATDLSLEFFAEHSTADEQTVLPAILMALHHLTSIEFLDVVASGREDLGEGTVQAAMIRKTAWRRLTRERRAGLGGLYVQVTDDHSEKVGDQVLFIVPTLWQQARDRLAGRPRTDAPADPSRLHQLLWSLADPR